MPKRILIVEDEGDIASALQEILETEFVTATATGSDEALERLRNFQPDLILLDMVLAWGTGIQVLQTAFGLTPPVPVLVLSGYAEEIDLASFGPLVADVMAKPFRAEELLHRIRQALYHPPSGVAHPRRSGGGAQRHILLAEHDAAFAGELVRHLGEAGYAVTGVRTPEEAEANLRQRSFDAVVADGILPGTTGPDLIRRLNAIQPAIPAILLADYATSRFVRRALECGASWVLNKPFPPRALPLAVETCLQKAASGTEGSLEKSRQGGRRASASTLRFSLADIQGQSPAIGRAREMLAHIARMDSHALIQGETGSGKELFAQALHAASERRSGPYVALNAAALPESLIESELFGYASGAFTGARREGLSGKFVKASGGTLFLDEIGDMPLHLQPKLLRALEEGVVTPLGGEPRRVDVRVVAATHRDLAQMVREGRFRADLFYRISTMVLSVPPLRDRSGDVAVLAQQFLNDLTARYKRAGSLCSSALAILESHEWPGNVRELKNAMEFAFALATDGEIRPEHLPEAFRAPNSRCPRGSGNDEREQLAAALQRCGGNRTHTAKLLGISRSNLYMKLKLCGLV